MTTCPVCNAEASNIEPQEIVGEFRIGVGCECGNCGKFFTSREATHQLAALDRPQRQKLSKWIRWNTKNELLVPDIAVALEARKPPINERAKRLLALFAREYPEGKSYHHGMSCLPSEWESVSWSDDSQALAFLIKSVLCDEFGWIDSSQGSYSVSPKGWKFLETEDVDSKSCFVAMWFDESMRHIFDDAICNAVKACGFDPVRVDRVSQNGKIDDQIIAELRRAKFVIADFTAHRAGVYYEAGYAHGLGKQVIFTCRVDEIKSLHFDVRQFNTILWTPEELTKFESALVHRIRATIPGAKFA